MNNADRAAYLARAVFTCGDEPNDKVQRIALKGGSYPDHETDLGGLSEGALSNLLRRALDEADAR